MRLLSADDKISGRPLTMCLDGLVIARRLLKSITDDLCKAELTKADSRIWLAGGLSDRWGAGRR